MLRKWGWARGHRLQFPVFSCNQMISDRCDDCIEKHIRGVASQEVILRLLGGKLANGREDTESIASQHDDIAWLPVDHAGNLRVRDVFDRVRAAGVLRDRNVVVIRHTRDGIVDDVLQDRAETDGVEDFWLLLSGEVDGLGVATTLDVEDTSI